MSTNKNNTKGSLSIKDLNSILASLVTEPVAEPEPAPVEEPEVIEEPAEEVAEAAVMASAISALGGAVISLMRDAAEVSVTVAEAGGLNTADRREISLRRQAQLESAAGFIMSEISAIYAAAKPVIEEAAKASVEVALAAARAEAAQDAEIEELHHAKHKLTLKRELRALEREEELLELRHAKEIHELKKIK